MFRISRHIVIGIALGLTFSSLGSAASKGPALADLIPDLAANAVLVDVAELRDVLGPALREGPAAGWLDSLAARGWPDVRSDIDRAAIAFDTIETPSGSTEISRLVVTAEGRIRRGRTLAALARSAEGPLAMEAYRGVAIYAGSGRENETVRLGFQGDELAVLAAERAPARSMMFESLDVLAGRRAGYGESRGISLPPGTVISVGLDVPESVREKLRSNPLTAPLAVIDRVTGTLQQLDERRLRIVVTGRTGNFLQAQALRLALAGIRRQALARDDLDPRVRRVLEATAVSASGKEVSISVELERQAAQELLAAAIGDRG